MKTWKHFYFVLSKSTSSLPWQWLPPFLLAFQSLYEKSWRMFVHSVALWWSHKSPREFLCLYIVCWVWSHFQAETTLIFPGSAKSSNNRLSVILSNSLAFCGCLFCLSNVLIQYRNEGLSAFLSVCLSLVNFLLCSMFTVVFSVFFFLNKKLERAKCRQNFWWCKNYKVFPFFSAMSCLK